MNVLYITSHDVLEKDELNILDNLGFNFFSVGFHSNPPEGYFKNYRYDLIDEFASLHNNWWENGKIRKDVVLRGATDGSIFRVKPEFLRKFDIFIVSNFQENITINWEGMKHGKVIYRTIGQLQTHLSPYINDCFNIAYSEVESKINPIKFHCVIRPYVDLSKFSLWEGGEKYLLTVTKRFRKRGDWCCWNIYDRITYDFPRLICGSENEEIPFAVCDASFEEIQERRKKCKMYFNTVTKPGPYTFSFIEALATGCPIISIGPKMGSLSPNQQTFLVDKFIKNGVNGFYSDNPQELYNYIITLWNDTSLCQKISKEARKTAEQYFSFESALNKWRQVFNEMHSLPT